MERNFQSSEMQEILQDFIGESEELLEALDQNLVRLEKEPDNLELLNEAFRSVHTIKGASSFLGFDPLVELTHHTENVLNKLCKKEAEVNPSLIEIILQAVDTVKVLIGRIRNQQPLTIDLSPLIKKLEEVLVSSFLTPKMGIEEKIEEEGPGLTSSKNDYSIRVEVKRLDEVMNLVGELVLGRNRLLKLSLLWGDEYQDEELGNNLAEVAAHLDLITTELQLAVMKARMLPIKKLFNKFPRMVRDWAKEKGKEIDLKIWGEDTELDKSVIEEIGDPLIHLVRNAIDHGIESVQERELLGKSKKGEVLLSAHHEGNYIIIEIQDDGRGIDTELVKKKVLEKGILGKNEIQGLSEEECLNLIFLPGFSTAKEVTEVSGRGVGMDVVKTHIMKLNGIIQIKTEVTKGTKISLRLPLTLAIIHSLIVEIEKEIFAIPLVSVIETVRISPQNIQTINNREVIKLRNSILPLLYLKREFNLSSAKENTEKLYVVVVGLAEKRVGIVVEGLKGQEEVVIKPLGKYFSDLKGIIGATITGEGKVILILDVPALILESEKRIFRGEKNIG